MSELLSGLEPYTRYHLRVAAYTGGSSSEYSDQFTAFTDVAGPEEPNITNYTVIDSHSIYISWEEPKTFYKSVNRFFIHYWDPKHSNNHGELIADGEDTEKLITGLRTNHIYKLKIAGVTESIFSQSYYVGKFSEPVMFELTGVEPEEGHQMETISAGTLAGILIGVGIIIVAFGLFVCYRISLLHPLKSEDPDHVYAEIEPHRVNVESPSTSSGAVPLPMKMHKRQLDVSIMRDVSMRFSGLFGKDSMHSAANDAIFFSKKSESVRTRTLPSLSDFLNEDHKGKRRVTHQKLPSALLLEGSSQMSFTSAGVSIEMHERENVYNPLMKTDSIPYDELKFRKTGSGAHSITDEGAHGSSGDNSFTGKGVKGESSKWGQKSHRYYKDRLDKDLSPKPTEFENMQEDNRNTKLDTINSISPNETSESKQEHNFVLETTASLAGSEDRTGQSSQKPFAPQYQMNAESSRASYELAKNVSNLDDKHNHSDDEFLSTSSSLSHITLSGIHQMSDNQSHLCTESTYNSVNNYDVHAAEQISFAEDNSKAGHEYSNITIKKNTSSDDYMEPVKSNTVSEYLEIIPCVP